MIDRPTQRIAVILERTLLPGPWATAQWDLAGVVPDVGGEPRTIVEAPGRVQRLYPGVELCLYRDEAEGYYLNASTESPSVFVALRTDEATGEPYPYQATLSYNEAARWMDGSERVERAVAWPELTAWMGTWVEENYRPEPKKRQRPKSFVGKEGRLREKTGR